jgi:hypothetical protein
MTPVVEMTVKIWSKAGRFAMNGILGLLSIGQVPDAPGEMDKSLQFHREFVSNGVPVVGYPRVLESS